MKKKFLLILLFDLLCSCAMLGTSSQYQYHFKKISIKKDFTTGYMNTSYIYSRFKNGSLYTYDQQAPAYNIEIAQISCKTNFKGAIYSGTSVFSYKFFPEHSSKPIYVAKVSYSTSSAHIDYSVRKDHVQKALFTNNIDQFIEHLKKNGIQEGQSVSFSSNDNSIGSALTLVAMSPLYAVGYTAGAALYAGEAVARDLKDPNGVLNTSMKAANKSLQEEQRKQEQRDRDLALAIASKSGSSSSATSKAGSNTTAAGITLEVSNSKTVGTPESCTDKSRWRNDYKPLTSEANIRHNETVSRHNIEADKQCGLDYAGDDQKKRSEVIKRYQDQLTQLKQTQATELAVFRKSNRPKSTSRGPTMSQ